MRDSAAVAEGLDGRGNFTMGLKDQSSITEIDYHEGGQGARMEVAGEPPRRPTRKRADVRCWALPPDELAFQRGKDEMATQQRWPRKRKTLKFKTGHRSRCKLWGGRGLMRKSTCAVCASGSWRSKAM